MRHRCDAGRTFGRIWSAAITVPRRTARGHDTTATLGSASGRASFATVTPTPQWSQSSKARCQQIGPVRTKLLRSRFAAHGLRHQSSLFAPEDFEFSRKLFDFLTTLVVSGSGHPAHPVEDRTLDLLQPLLTLRRPIRILPHADFLLRGGTFLRGRKGWNRKQESDQADLQDCITPSHRSSQETTTRGFGRFPPRPPPRPALSANCSA